MKVTIPKGWHEVTIATYQTICDIEQAGLDAMDRQIQIIAVLAGVKQSEAEDLTITQIREIMAGLKWLSEKPTKFINRFKIDGKVYVVDCNMATMTAAQYIDMSEYAKENVNENLHKIMTVFVKPTKKRILGRSVMGYGQGYELHDLSEVFRKQMTMEIVFPLSLFFCTLWDKLQPVILSYLNEQQKVLTEQMVAELKILSQSVGGGSSS